MAISESIRAAIGALSKDLNEAESLAQSFVDLAGQNASWPFVIARQIERLRASAATLELLTHRLDQQVEGAPEGPPAKASLRAVRIYAPGLPEALDTRLCATKGKTA